MTWDPMELGWKTLKGTIQFFQYSTKLDCSILQHKNLEQEGLSSKWIREELDDDFLKQYWKQLWVSKIAEKINAFLLLCSHRTLPIGVWMQKRGIDGNCSCALQDSNL